MPKVGLSFGSSFEKLFNKAPDPPKLHVFSCLCFLGCIPILPTNLIPNLVLVSFSVTPLLRVPFPVLTLPLKNICVPSCQVYGKYIPFRFSLYLHHIDNKHRCYTTRFIVHLVRLSNSPSPPSFPLPILPTSLKLLHSSPSFHPFSHRKAYFLPIPQTSPKLLCSSQSPHLSSLRPTSPTLSTPPVLARTAGLLGPTPLPPSPSHTPDPLPIPTNSPTSPPSPSPPLNHHPM